jgi:gliding motility-associated-like protein
MPTSNTQFCQSLVPCGNFSVIATSLCPAPCFTFQEESYLADSWNWTFNGGIPESSTAQNPPPVCFGTPGLHEVSVTFTNQFGSTTWSQMVNSTPDCPFTIPNVFTPNGDGLNEIFEADGLTEPFSLVIFNRWGMEIFSAAAPGTGWDGKSENGTRATPGIYFYILRLPESNRNFSGTVMLIE